MPHVDTQVLTSACGCRAQCENGHLCCPPHCAHQTVPTTLYPPHCTHHTVHTTLYPPNCTHHTVHTTLYPPNCAHHTVPTKLCTPNCAHQCTPHCAYHTVTAGLSAWESVRGVGVGQRDGVGVGGEAKMYCQLFLPLPAASGCL